MSYQILNASRAVILSEIILNHYAFFPCFLIMGSFLSQNLAGFIFTSHNLLLSIIDVLSIAGLKPSLSIHVLNTPLQLHLVQIQEANGCCPLAIQGRQFICRKSFHLKVLLPEETLDDHVFLVIGDLTKAKHHLLGFPRYCCFIARLRSTRSFI